ncbi:transcriptional regulator [Methanocella sp. CWC-04]|uniref:Transcriptional regulator n=1 Tax=Methanooceanicella nereidis TaxID=2052831 RepID=A0AAP2RBG2_9EURY|nr:CBS domain-containing protein [Methanocella sp. CWC-04]MCD1294248.1 transcriptional regulator [Methanocella sp. CWC-04]
MELPTPESIKKRRMKLGLTQSALAEKANVSQPLIARIESGDVDPRLSTLRSIINALDEMEKCKVTAKDLMTSQIISLSPEDTVDKAVKLMEKYGFSQLPVIEKGVPIGSISESILVQAMGSEDISRISTSKVKQYMDESFPAVSPRTDMGTVSHLLESYHAVLVMELGKVVGVITKYDIMRLLK